MCSILRKPITSSGFTIFGGGNCLDIAKQFGLAKEYSDLHFRGEYWIADDKYKDFVKTTIYTVAEFKGYPFLDPHWITKAN